MAKERLRKYLSSSYDGAESFLKNIIFPVFGEDKFERLNEVELLSNHPEYHNLAKKSGISSIKRVGEVWVETNPLLIWDIAVTNRVQMARNRVGIQALIRRMMDTHSLAFMLFHYEHQDAQEWRFTFCHKAGSSKEASDSKRFTFLLGPKQNCRTATDNFQKLIDKAKQDKIRVEDLQQAFSVEALTKEFFQKYHQHNKRFVEYITGKDEEAGKDGKAHQGLAKSTKAQIGNKTAPHPLHEEQFQGKEKHVSDYVKKLIGRIVFLHYLQRKGWLGVHDGEQWGRGDTEFMQHLFEYARDEQKADFVEQVLNPLFYGALNTNRSHNGDLFDTQVQFPTGVSSLRIPYLNGGLFEADENDKRRVQFPAEYFKDLLDFFSQYNFTVDENDPSDAQVGVDPEMLGRIFESLLDDKKDKGAYYTPKEIVQYMCRESLIAYLCTDLDTEIKDLDPKIATTKYQAAIVKFVRTNNAEDLRVTEQNEELNLGLQAKILDKLTKVKICDPAIGSGAFPMGLLRELYNCRIALQEQGVSAMEIKRQIIKNNIYGVDIERGAVDIARLRFWLSLVVDEEKPLPLPNLDYKIMQGNSLLESYGKYDLSNLTKRKEIKVGCCVFGLFEETVDVRRRELRKAVSDYYEATDHALKEKLRQRINAIVRLLFKEPGYDINLAGIDLSANSDFFLWHTWFDDVFSCPSGRNGFDIVIGNPPWGAKLSSEKKAEYQKLYQSAKTIKGVQKGSLDTYSLFIELGYKIATSKGICAFIVPLSITSSDAMQGLHRILLSNSKELLVSSFGDRPRRIFENAEQQVSIILFHKASNLQPKVYTTRINKRNALQSIDVMIENLEFTTVDVSLIRKGRIPKVGYSIEVDILRKILLAPSTIGQTRNSHQEEPIFYRKAGGRYYKIITLVPTESSAEGKVVVDSRYKKAIAAIMSSNLYYWYWLIHSDWHNMRSLEVVWFPLPSLTDENMNVLDRLFENYYRDIEANSTHTSTGLKRYFIRKSKKYIDQIDDYICPLYGLSLKETEFIKNYEIEFRLAGDD